MQYKGEFINVSDYDGTFSCPALEISFVETYREICAKIDAQKKKEKEVTKRIPVFMISRDNKNVYSGLAGAMEKDRSYVHFWVSFPDGNEWGKSRSKERAEDLILNTPENRAIFEKMNDIQGRIDALEEEIEVLDESLVTLATASDDAKE